MTSPDRDDIMVAPDAIRGMDDRRLIIKSHRDDSMVGRWLEEQEFPPFDDDYQKD